MSNLHITRSIIILSDIFIVISWIIAVIGINKKNYIFLKLALLFWSIFLCFWIGSVILSVSKSGEKYLCSFGRCPESMWLFNNSWHKDSLLTLSLDYELDYNYVIKPVVLISDMINDYDRNGKANTLKENALNFKQSFVDEQTYPQNKYQSYEKLQKNGELRQVSNITSTPRSAAVINLNDMKLNSDRVITLPLQNITRKSSFNENVLTAILIVITFGILAFGWLLLFSHVFILKHHIKRFCVTHAENKSTTCNVSAKFRM